MNIVNRNNEVISKLYLVALTAAFIRAENKARKIYDKKPLSPMIGKEVFLWN